MLSDSEKAKRLKIIINGKYSKMNELADKIEVKPSQLSRIVSTGKYSSESRSKLVAAGIDMDYVEGLSNKNNDNVILGSPNQNKVEFINFQIPKDAVMIPEYGSPVHAGNPALAYNDLVGMVNATRHLHAQSYYVRVKGRSMEGRNIKEGQRLLVDGSLEPRNGNLVVAWVNSEYTVKVFKENGGQWLLNPDPDPENPEEFNPIRYDDTDGKMQIVGVVVRSEQDFV